VTPEIDRRWPAVLAVLGLALAVVVWLAIVIAGLSAGGCGAGTKGAAFASGVQANCAAVLADAGADVVGQAVASAEGAPGAPSWGSFSIGELITRGIPFAICVVQQGLAVLDMKLPAAPTLDAAGNVDVAKATPPARAFLSPQTPREFSAAEVAQLQAHARLVDFLAAHGATHAHATVGPQ
jgi:hypothetical protein